ncbi:nucleoside-diphosphate kinase [Clostridium baratii]|uniref:nucleoside-diphosphate kinase n=1 Tax=Clostridium baratii TaxID=1561 RepID=UPI0005F296D6|nr:nucleoside-diphosphate kinase [Clostridium baratii]AQM58850.1 nucleoside-diphosphate kinase [Clostridium baratii]KJU70835.1 nucleoside diphosphate kinase [Clostridium baratii]MBS6044014.1 nucleoside-diphosphate kinase [Clostridium baratii]
MEKSLVLIKPDGVEKRLIGKIIKMYEEDGLTISELKMLKVSKELGMKHYEEHKGKEFFSKLINYITRGPVCAMILEGENAINRVRKINGATNPKVAEKGTIRYLYADNMTENCVHASDSNESAIRECELWFNEYK